VRGSRLDAIGKGAAGGGGGVREKEKVTKKGGAVQEKSIIRDIAGKLKGATGGVEEESRRKVFSDR